jgi:aspartyl-tRNA synthetase
MAICSGFEKVFEINPVYRANPSFTTRHDTEFTMIDIEMGFIENYTDLMDEEEKIIVAAFRAVKQKLGKKIKELYGIDTEVPVAPFPKIKLTEAKYILKTEYGIEGDDKYDLSPEEERAIGKHIREEYGHDFVFVTEYGTDARAFYTQKLEQEPEYSQSFDLLYRGIEITSGAKREHRVDTLSKQITHKGFSIEGFRDYLEFFRYGAPPHGGFAIGPSRLIMKLLGLPNVREATYIYRGINRLRP